MPDGLTKAHVNLFAVLHNLEDLCSLDKEAEALAASQNTSIQFSIHNGPSAYMVFKDGRCTFHKGKGQCGIKLYFSSPEHFNRMVDGKANPIILKGFTKLGFLQNEFTKLTKKLEYYLKPTNELLKDSTYFKINTILTFMTAFRALGEIGNSDKLGKEIEAHTPDGVLCISILDISRSLCLKSSHGHIEECSEKTIKPGVYLSFSDLKAVNEVLSSKVDINTAIGMGNVSIKGFIPILQNMAHILSLVHAYV